MILNFKTQIGGKPTNFVENTLSRQKIHSIRAGRRWKVGDTIHMSTGARTKNYKQFNKDLPHLQTVIDVQDIKIRWKTGAKTELANYDFRVFVDRRELVGQELRDLIDNDGFMLAYDFGDFFNKDFDGQIIHWTDYSY